MIADRGLAQHAVSDRVVYQVHHRVRGAKRTRVDKRSCYPALISVRCFPIGNTERQRIRVGGGKRASHYHSVMGQRRELSETDQRVAAC